MQGANTQTDHTDTLKTDGIGFREFVLLMAFLMSLTALSIDTMLPALSIMGQELGTQSENGAQNIIAFLFYGLACGLAFYGPLSDCIGRKKAIYLGLGVFIIGSIVSLLATTMTTMLIGRFIQGLGVAGPRIIVAALVRDHFEGRAMARVMSFVMSIFILMPAVAPLIGQGVLHMSGWRTIFVVFMALSMLALVWSAMRLGETVPKEKRIPFAPNAILSGFKTVLKNPLTVGYTIVSALSFSALVAYIITSPQIFKDLYGIEDTFPYYFAAIALVIGASAIVNAQLVMRLGMRNLTNKAFVVIAVCSVLMVLRLWLNEAAPSIWEFMGYALIVMFAMGLTFGNLNALALEPAKKNIGIAAAVVGSLNTALSTLIGAAIGQLYAHSLMPIIGGYAIVSILALIGMKLLDGYADKDDA